MVRQLQKKPSQHSSKKAVKYDFVKYNADQMVQFLEEVGKEQLEYFLSHLILLHLFIAQIQKQRFQKKTGHG